MRNKQKHREAAPRFWYSYREKPKIEVKFVLLDNFDNSGEGKLAKIGSIYLNQKTK